VCHLQKEGSIGEVLLLMDRLINIYVRDKHGNLLPDCTIDVEVDGDHFGTFEAAEGHASVGMGGRRVNVRLTATYDGSSQSALLGPDTDQFTFEFAVTGRYSTMYRDIALGALASVIIVGAIVALFYLGLLAGAMPLVTGMLLLIAAVALAFIFPEQNNLQQHLVRGMFALGVGLVASQIPGLINIDLGLGEKAKITAGGALAVYVISYFFVPAKDS
jgi:hypothetical protein